MKSWSLGRKSGKREVKQRDADSTSNRPKSMIISSPSVASNSTDLLSSIQASPSLTFPSADRSFSSTSSMGAEAGRETHNYTASKYLSSAQLKDQARRETKASPAERHSSRPPLTSKTNLQPDFVRTRTSSLPSLMKSPAHSSAVPSSAALSPTAAMARGMHSNENKQHHNQQTATTHHESSLSTSSSMRSIDSFQQPPSPTRTQLSHTGVPRTRLTSITSELPSRKDNNKSSPKAGQDKAKSKLEVTQRPHSTGEKAGAIASLRRLKGADDILIDARQLDNVDSMSVLESRSSTEEVKERGKPMEEDTVQESPPKAHVPDEETPSPVKSAKEAQYSYAIRKGKGTSKHLGPPSTQKVVRTEARLNLVIHTTSPAIPRLRRGETHRGNARLLITAPVPSLLGCDRLAYWAVERVSRLTSCVIQVFGT